MKNPKLIKVASCKRENRRIEITFWQGDEGETAVTISTKRLIDRQRRHILKSTVHYGYETAAMLHDMLNLLFDDPDFNAATNKERGQLLKTKWNVKTNIDY